MGEQDEIIDTASLANQLQHLELEEQTDTSPGDKTDKADPSLTILCDMGYGLPREERPKKERLNAICRQLCNFLVWQHHEQKHHLAKAQVVIAACPDPAAVRRRLQELDCPMLDNLNISADPLEQHVLEEDSVYYLSPDAPTALDATKAPPRAVVVGLLIDRRVQPGRSLTRATQKLQMPAARWPDLPGWDPSEPFNVDCILEGMQQWHWNYYDSPSQSSLDSTSEAFLQAAQQAIRHHCERHPQRSQHIPGAK